MSLFGTSLALTVQTVANAAAAERDAVRGKGGPSAVIRAIGDGCLTKWLTPAVPTIDVACAAYETPETDANPIGGEPTSLTAGAKSGILLHTQPSRRTIRHVGSSEMAATLPPAPNGRRRVEVWHESLARFGGEQLNQRYRRRFDAPMDSDAWAAWIAVKIVAESSLRAHATTPDELAHALSDARMQFDGQKGRPLIFDPRTGELIQPLYIVDSGADSGRSTVIAEVLPEDR
jgi:hypothetical protein